MSEYNWIHFYSKWFNTSDKGNNVIVFLLERKKIWTVIKIAEIAFIKNVTSYTPKLMNLSKSCIEKKFTAS